MTAELEDRIRERLTRTGFPGEFRAAAVLEKKGFWVQHSPYYIDLDENKSREVDLVASWLDEELQNVSWYHVLECKKMEEPQVIFSSSTAEFARFPLMSRDAVWPAGALPAPSGFIPAWRDALLRK